MQLIARCRRLRVGASTAPSLRRALSGSFVLACLCAALVGCGGPSRHSGEGKSQFDGIEARGLIAPDFALRDQHGRLIRLGSERNRFVIVTFMYVHCPDICPAVAGQLNAGLRRLGPERRDVRVLAISVDPRGDTPTAVAHFIATHHLLPQFLYLTGTLKQLRPIWTEYHIASTETPKGVVVGHTSVELLLDRTLKPRVIYDAHVTSNAVVHDLRALGLHA